MTEPLEQLPIRQRVAIRLERLYDPETSAELTKCILRLMDVHCQMRSRRLTGDYWDESDTVLITYGDTVCHADQAPLQTLKGFLDTHLRDAFSMVHVLPFFPWSSDDGFSVTDFRAVKKELGTWEDIESLNEHFDLAIDMVLNHCSRENLWFLDYIFGEEPACQYFIEADPDEDDLSAVVRPRALPLLSGVRTHRGMRHVWTTFSNDQIDLNYKNPDVLVEFIDILLYYVRRGARMIRLDAVAYLWKEIGTSCIHLPQTHEVVKLFRDILSEIEPAALIMTETNVPHEENISYFGQGDEAHIVYQFSLPPLLLYSLWSANTQYLTQWARGISEMDLPQECTFLNFTASHDGIGMRPLEGLVPKEEIGEMLEAMRERGGYVSTKTNSDGTESPYELNITYFDAFRQPLGSENQFHIPKFLLSQTVALTLRGVPAVYFHSLTATPNDNNGVERTGMTRSINRKHWDLSELQVLMSNPESETGRVFEAYGRLLRLRRRYKAFHPNAAQEILELPNGLFGIKRVSCDGEQCIIGLFNFSRHIIHLSPEEVFGEQAPLTWHELIRDQIIDSRDAPFCMVSYGAMWLTPA